jgi:peptidoglycan/xylan/chitin deacetylase (PgdA/CDA1 family)
MTYGRTRLAVLLIAALALLSEPAGASVPPVARALTGARVDRLSTTGDLPDAQSSAAPGSQASKRPASRPPASDPGSHPGNASANPSPKGEPSRHGPAGTAKRTGSASVALTFDDGPDPEQTPQLLDLLAQQQVKATFCLVGFRARDHPELVRRIVAEGHTVCNHSWQHLIDLGMRPADVIANDLKATNDAIYAAAPDAKIRYFRAPGGNFTPPLVGLARAQGMTSIYWDVDPRDWDHRKNSDDVHIARVIAEIQASTRPGAIVLSHDNRQPDTIQAYRTLLPWLKARFTLIPLPT